MLQEKLYSRKIVVCDTENTYVYFQVYLTGNQFNVITIYVVFNFSSSESRFTVVFVLQNRFHSLDLYEFFENF